MRTCGSLERSSSPQLVLTPAGGRRDASLHGVMIADYAKACCRFFLCPNKPLWLRGQASRIIRQYSYFIVAAAPATMATKVMMAPTDSVENPVMP